MLLKVADIGQSKLYLQTILSLQSLQLTWKSILYRKHDLREKLRIDLSKIYGNGVLFHKAVSHK